VKDISSSTAKLFLPETPFQELKGHQSADRNPLLAGHQIATQSDEFYTLTCGKSNQNMVSG
jgi:hypothetical protein